MRLITLTTALILLISAGTAVKIDSMTFDPAQPEYNDTVDVFSHVDAQGGYITSTELTVYEDGNAIHEKEMTLSEGSRTGLAKFRENMAFDIDRNVSYLVRIKSYTESGDNAVFKRELEVENGTVTVKTLDTGKDQTVNVFGLKLSFPQIISLTIIGVLIAAVLGLD